MEYVIEEILSELKNKCDSETFIYLQNFIIIKLNGYKVEKKETGIVKYEMSKSEKWFKMFLISKKLQGLSERSLKCYKNEIKRSLMVINKPLDEISTDDIRYFLACYQLTGKANSTTIDNTRRYLSTFFQWLEDEEYILKNPIRRIKKVKQKKTVKKAFSYEEIEKIKMACKNIEKAIYKERAIAIVEFLLSTGCRADELINVKITNINFNTNEVMVTGKGNKERIVYLNAAAKLRIKDYLNVRNAASEYVFTEIISPFGRLTGDTIGAIVRNIGKKANVEHVHPHRFRRTCATIASKRGMPIEEISKMLGHEDLRTTQIYVQVETDSIKQSHEKYMN